MIEFIDTDHIEHLLWGDITEVYAGSATLHLGPDGELYIGRTLAAEEMTNHTFDIQGCHTCEVEFIQEEN